QLIESNLSAWLWVYGCWSSYTPGGRDKMGRGGMALHQKTPRLQNPPPADMTTKPFKLIIEYGLSHQAALLWTCASPESGARSVAMRMFTSRCSSRASVIRSS